MPEARGVAAILGATSEKLHRGRCISCKRAVDITEFAWDVAMGFSKALVAKGEPPLRDDERAWCDACGEQREQREQREAEKRHVIAQRLFAEMRDNWEMSYAEKRQWLSERPYWFTGEYRDATDNWLRCQGPNEAARKGKAGATDNARGQFKGYFGTGGG